MPDPGMNALLVEQAQPNAWFPLMRPYLPDGIAQWMLQAGVPNGGQAVPQAPRPINRQPRMSPGGLFPPGGSSPQANFAAGDPTFSQLNVFGGGSVGPGPGSSPSASSGQPVVAPGTGPLRPPNAHYQGVPHVRVNPALVPQTSAAQPFGRYQQAAPAGQPTLNQLYALTNPTLAALYGAGSRPQAPNPEQTSGISAQTRQNMLAQGYPDPWALPNLGVRLDPDGEMSGWDEGQARTPGTLQFVMHQLDRHYAGDGWYRANRDKVKYRIQQDMAGYIQSGQLYPVLAGRNVIHDMRAQPAEQQVSAASAGGGQQDDSFPDLLLRAWGNVKDAYHSVVNQPSSSILTYGEDERGRPLPPRTISAAERDQAYQQIASVVPNAIEGAYRRFVDHPSAPMMTVGFDPQGKPLAPRMQPYDPSSDPLLAFLRAGSQLVNLPAMGVAPELALEHPGRFVGGIVDQAKAPFDSSLSPEQRLEGGLNTAGLLYGLWHGELSGYEPAPGGFSLQPIVGESEGVRAGATGPAKGLLARTVPSSSPEHAPPLAANAESPELLSVPRQIGTQAAKDAPLIKAAKKTESSSKPVVSASQTDSEIVNGLADYFGKIIDDHPSVNPKFVPPYSTDVNNANALIQKWLSSDQGHDLSEPERDLFHFLSSASSGIANPAFDSATGALLLERYLKSEQISPYTNDAPKFVRSIANTRRDVGVPDVQAGRVRPGMPGPGVNAKAIQGLSDLMTRQFQGDLPATMDWLRTPHPTSEIEALTGRKLPVHEYTEGPESYGIFGLMPPKQGSYFLNRVGIHDTFPKDVHFARGMASAFGEPLIDKYGKVISEPWDPATPEGLRLRKLSDAGAALAGESRGLTLGDVSGIYWDYVRQMYHKNGAGLSPSLMADGVRSAIARIRDDQGFEAYEPGRAATAAESTNAKTWKVLSSFRRSVRKGDSPAEGGDLGVHPGTSGMGGYARVAGSNRRPLPGSELGPSVASNLTPVQAKYAPTARFKRVIRSLGGTPMEFHELRDPGLFHALVQRAHAENPLAAGVGAYLPEDYRGMQLFVTKDGTAGFARNGDEIVSPFKSGQGSLGMHSILQLATDLGGRRLRVFDTIHPSTASQMGFKAVGRSPFDDALAPVDPAFFRDFNGGYPDILHLVWDPEMATQYKPTHGKFFETAERAAQEQHRAIQVIRNRPSTKNSKLNY